MLEIGVLIIFADSFNAWTMQQYHIRFFLTNKDSIDAKSVAGSLEDAVDNILATDQAKDFIGENDIDSIQLIGVEPAEPVSTERFILQKSKNPGYWVITDKQNNIVCKFLEHYYNSEHTLTDINDNPITDALTVATALREMGEYLSKKHSELIF